MEEEIIKFKYDDKTLIYELTVNSNNAFDKAEFINKYTDYFIPYDYILGDISADILRLKGFNSSKNKNKNKYNDYKNIDKYIDKHCSLAKKYYILKKKKS